MPATQGTSGFGSRLKIGDGGGSEVFTDIAEVKSINGPTFSLETIDATHMASPEGHREILPSFKSAGEVSFDVNFLPGIGTQAQIFTDWQNRTLRNFQVQYPDESNTKWQFSGYISNISITAPMDNVLSASITIVISGPVDFVP